MVIGNSLGGWLFDHWQPYGTVLAGICLNLGATGLLIFFHGWPAYPLLLVISGFGSGITSTAINSYATRIRDKRPSVVFNILYFTSNLGLVIGTLIVGFVLPYGIAMVFALAALLFAVFLVVAIWHYRIERETPTAAEQPVVRGSRNPARPRLIMLMVTLFVTWLMYEQWQSNISAFMLSEGLTVKDYSFLWTVNALLIVLFQPVLTAFDHWLLQHIRLRLIGGFVLFAGSFFDFAKWFRAISDIYCCYGGFDFRRNSGIAGSFNLCHFVYAACTTRALSRIDSRLCVSGPSTGAIVRRNGD